MRINPPRDMLDYLDSIGVKSPGNSPKTTEGSSPVSNKTMGRFLVCLVPGLLLTLGCIIRWLGVLSIALGLACCESTADAQDPHGVPESIAPEMKRSRLEPDSWPVSWPTSTPPNFFSRSADMPGERWALPNSLLQPNHQSAAQPVDVPVHALPQKTTAMAPVATVRSPEPLRDLESSPHTYMSREIVIGTGLFACLLVCMLCFFNWAEGRVAYEALINQPPVRSSLDLADELNKPTQSIEAEVFGQSPQQAHAIDEAVPHELADCSPSWQTGVYSCQGNVRRQNQDYAVSFKQARWSVLIIADGCGGIPFGAEASRIAVDACASAMREMYAAPLASIRKGFESAAQALFDKGVELDILTLDGGLRTTLIVAVATEDHFCFGYIGDGALQILRTNGVVIDCILPQRASMDVSNVLSASLGPAIQGNAQFGTAPRVSGDLLLAGTDGVFDRVGDRFAFEVMRMAIYHQGNLQSASKDILNQLSQMVDPEGNFIFDDNLTLGLISDGEHPKLSPEFWRSSKVSLTHGE